VKKLTDIFQNEEEYNDHDYTENAETQSTIVEVRYSTMQLIKQLLCAQFENYRYFFDFRMLKMIRNI